MNPIIKNILKRGGIYHPIQSFYRGSLRTFNRWYYRAKYAKYKGPGYTCNFCNASYSKFVPWHPASANRAAIERNQVVAGYGENIICPNCLSTARERLVLCMFQNELPVEGKKIFHLSPEKHILDYLKERANVVSADYYPGFYKNIDAHVQFADATVLAFDNETFDIVIANHVMEHIPADNKAMREIYRVLKPGGRAMLQVPFSTFLPATIEDPGINDPKRQSALFGQHDHVRIYSLQEYIKRLRDTGFKVEYISPEQLAAYRQYATQPAEGFLRIMK